MSVRVCNWAFILFTDECAIRAKQIHLTLRTLLDQRTPFWQSTPSPLTATPPTSSNLRTSNKSCIRLRHLHSSGAYCLCKFHLSLILRVNELDALFRLFSPPPCFHVTTLLHPNSCVSHCCPFYMSFFILVRSSLVTPTSLPLSFM